MKFYRDITESSETVMEDQIVANCLTEFLKLGWNSSIHTLGNWKAF
jgi:hypothetical protein